jgi:hypothetical protein
MKPKEKNLKENRNFYNDIIDFKHEISTQKIFIDKLIDEMPLNNNSVLKLTEFNALLRNDKLWKYFKDFKTLNRSIQEYFTIVEPKFNSLRNSKYKLLRKYLQNFTDELSDYKNEIHQNYKLF